MAKPCMEKGLALPGRRRGHNGGPYSPGHSRFAKYLVALQAPLSLTTRKVAHFPCGSLGAPDSLSVRPRAVLSILTPFPDGWVWRRTLAIVHHLQDEMMGQEGAETFTPPEGFKEGTSTAAGLHFQAKLSHWPSPDLSRRDSIRV